MRSSQLEVGVRGNGFRLNEDIETELGFIRSALTSLSTCHLTKNFSNFYNSRRKVFHSDFNQSTGCWRGSPQAIQPAGVSTQVSLALMLRWSRDIKELQRGWPEPITPFCSAIQLWGTSPQGGQLGWARPVFFLPVLGFHDHYCTACFHMEGKSNWVGREETILTCSRGKARSPHYWTPDCLVREERRGYFSSLLCSSRPRQLVWIQISICTLGSQFLLDPAPAPSEVHPSLIFTWVTLKSLMGKYVLV